MDMAGATASQSSTWGDGSFQRASNAIDGNAANGWDQGSCTHTNVETSPWWQVALPQAHAIVEIEITNRGDCCGERLNGFDVLVDGTKCASNVQIKQGETKTVPCTALGKVVRVSLPGRKTSLTICELRVRAGEFLPFLPGPCLCLSSALSAPFGTLASIHMPDHSLRFSFPPSTVIRIRWPLLHRPFPHCPFPRSLAST